MTGRQQTRTEEVMDTGILPMLGPLAEGAG